MILINLTNRLRKLWKIKIKKELSLIKDNKIFVSNEPTKVKFFIEQPLSNVNLITYKLDFSPQHMCMVSMQLYCKIS